MQPGPFVPNENLGRPGETGESHERRDGSEHFEAQHQWQ
jgi:hypothetical protein